MNEYKEDNMKSQRIIVYKIRWEYDAKWWAWWKCVKCQTCCLHEMIIMSVYGCIPPLQHNMIVMYRYCSGIVAWKHCKNMQDGTNMIKITQRLIYKPKGEKQFLICMRTWVPISMMDSWGHVIWRCMSLEHDQ